MSNSNALDLVQEVVTPMLDSLRAIIDDVASPNARPSRLTSILGIDKSLASRLVKTVRCNDPLEALDQSPAPQGLRLLVSAAEQAGVAAKLCEDASKGIEDFESLLDRLPGGRSSLNAMLSGLLPEARERGERAAKQAIFRSMSYLLGLENRASILTRIMVPSEDPKTVDVVNVGVTYDLFRWHDKHPHRYWYMSGGGKSHRNRVETLDGVRGSDDPADYVLHDFATQPLPKIEAVRGEHNVEFVLGPQVPQVSLPVTLPLAYVSRASIWYDEGDDDHYMDYAITSRTPSQLLVQDFIVHRDVFPGIDAESTCIRRGAPQNKETPADNAMDRVDLEIRSEKTEGRLPRSLSAELPRYPEMIQYVMDKVGLSIEDFRIYRMSMNYPPPFVMLRGWFQRPAGCDDPYWFRR